MKLSEIEKVHFIGIGGIGMSALARFFLHEKKRVSGSDRSPSEITKALEKEGATFFSSQVKENVADGIDLVVYTEAMPQGHEEMVAARALRVPMVNYFEALALVANQYYLIAVSGTHGKTTTTAMLTDVFEEAGLDPTAIIGSLRSKTGSNFRAGKSKYAIVEACEYRRDFLHLTPDVLVITNIEAEHLDYYKDLEDVQDAFHTFATQVREGGVVVTNPTDPNIAPILEGVSCKIIDYTKHLNPLLKLAQPGLHNQLDAAAAHAVAAFLDIDTKVTDSALEAFAGTWRRFEYKGELNGAKVYDDYGHHPTEITATLSGAREMYPDKKILLIYQPHLDSRTEALFLDFVSALGKADHVILTPAYAARATGGSHDSTRKLAEALEKVNKNTEYIEDFGKIEDRARELADAKTVVLIMGAGNITEIAETLTK